MIKKINFSTMIAAAVSMLFVFVTLSCGNFLNEKLNLSLTETKEVSEYKLVFDKVSGTLTISVSDADSAGALDITTLLKETSITMSDIRKVSIENGVTSLDAFAFKNLPNVKSIVIPNSVTSVGSTLFEGPYNEDLEITIEDGTDISGWNEDWYEGYTGEEAQFFYDNNGNLVFFDGIIPERDDSENSVKWFKGLYYTEGSQTFFNNPEQITLYNVSEIGQNAFCNMTKKCSITLSDNLVIIGNYNFCLYCSSLEASVTIPSTVENIGEYAFQSWGSACTITLGWASDDTSSRYLPGLSNVSGKITYNDETTGYTASGTSSGDGTTSSGNTSGN